MMLDASPKEQPILHIPWSLLALLLVVNTYQVDLHNSCLVSPFFSSALLIPIYSALSKFYLN